MLLVIDDRRLQGAAWAEYHTARKRLDQLARDLRRHEEVDVPAYDSWLHRTFPLLVTALRELLAEIEAKSRKIRAVQAHAAIYGGTLKRLWRQQKEREENPEKFRRAHEPEEQEDEPDADHARRYEAHPEDFERAPGKAPSADAREVYRRLVQRLHPDRGGEWTPARQRLWHEVQQAWQAGDVDWLARLEVDWDLAHEILGPHSPLSRLRRAIEELHAAQRDTEAKLREYRTAPAWRFTRNERNRASLEERTERNFAHDLQVLRRRLNHINATIAAWEEDWTRSDTRLKRRPRPRHN